MDRRIALRKTGLFAGATILMPTMLSLFESCKTENRLEWSPIFFSEDEAKTISSLVDTILPRTDTPGALDVKVDIFIDKVIAETYDQDGQEQMSFEISTFNEKCIDKFGRKFYDLKTDEKFEILKKMLIISQLVSIFFCNNFL